MRFYALGLNHECSSVERTEAFALDTDAQQSLYEDIELQEDAEVVVLSTCNRTEAYLYGAEEDVLDVKEALTRAADQPWPEKSFQHRDEAAVRHLLQVTSGLRSMVLGDGQILAQVKQAYQQAVDAGAVHSLMHRLMHTAFRAAKRVSTETALEQGAASVSTAAVEMARDYFVSSTPNEGLSEVDVVLVGAGKMGQLALEAMKEDGPASLTITNRSPDRAERVAQKFEADVVSWSRRHDAVAAADLALVATGAPHPILYGDDLPARDAGSSTLIVDIARPRNVEPSIAAQSGYELYDLDTLNAWTDAVQDRRAEAVPAAEAICEELLQDFVTWVFHQQALEPAIQAIRQTFDTIREQEVERHAHRTDMDREEVDRLTKSIMQKLLAVPIVRLKNVDPDSIDFVQGIELLHALFTPTNQESGGRSLQTVSDEVQPSLGEAPSQCPYLTHHPEGEEEHPDRLDQVLRMSEFLEEEPDEVPSSSVEN